MALSWSMDKIGPICRSVEDCAVVFNAIRGGDGIDQTVVDVPFAYDYSRTLSGLRIGYLKTDFDSAKVNKENDLATLAKLRSLGAKLVPIDLPKFPVPDMSIILSAEAAAAFDELTRSGADDQLVRQIKNAWPNSFRTARFIPAVEYIQANRHRTRLIAAMDSLLKLVDVYVSPSFDGDNLLLTNLTGHPCVVLPNGSTNRNTPTSITFIGRLYDEATVLAVAGVYQRATDFHSCRPPHGDPARGVR
jgi:Asp-tRNA(Asn)/Glu-tRNA(Gln) amidotransferase A subunit family amidase